jgi:tryptophanyl-tRNA synthetase
MDMNKTERPILVSAHNPMTGPRILGHHVSNFKEWRSLQKTHECYFAVDDIIAYLIYPRESKHILNRTLYTVRDYVASGIDVNLCHIFVTSQVPEFLELILWLGTAVDQTYCELLHRSSFTGLLAPYRRHGMGLHRYPSAAEVVYPQLGPPALALGLGASGFQGGEEIRGYVDIMTVIVVEFNRRFGDVLKLPEYVRPRVEFLVGTDGVHMANGNHVTLSAPPEAVRDACLQIRDYSVLRQWYTALDADERAGRLPPMGAPSDKDKEEMARFLIDLLAPYRNIKIKNAEIVDIVSKGSDAVRERVNSTIQRVKAAMGVADLNRLRGMLQRV